MQYAGDLSGILFSPVVDVEGLSGGQPPARHMTQHLAKNALGLARH